VSVDIRWASAWDSWIFRPPALIGVRAIVFQSEPVVYTLGVNIEDMPERIRCHRGGKLAISKA